MGTKLIALGAIAGAAAAVGDVLYLVDVDQGVAGSKKITLEELINAITLNITASALSAAAVAHALETVTVGVGSPNVIIASEHGKTFINTGGGAKTYHTLPAAATGLRFIFFNDITQGIRIVAAAGDTIRVLDQVSIAAGYAESTEQNAIVVLMAIDATRWIALTVYGTWDVETS